MAQQILKLNSDPMPRATAAQGEIADAHPARMCDREGRQRKRVLAQGRSNRMARKMGTILALVPPNERH
jgi:hypothetical protein